MLTQLLMTLIVAQMALGAFDIFYHHELTERLPWRVSQAREQGLHGARNLIYAGVFAIFAAVEPRGLLAWLLLSVLAVEVFITLVDFVEEDHSRRLPASERVTHALLALNYGAILALLAPRLAALGGDPTGLAIVWHGLWSWLATIAAGGCLVWGWRDLAARARAPRLVSPPAGGLAGALTRRHRVLVTGASGFIGRRLVAALTGGGHEVIALVRDPARLADLAPLTLVTDLDQVPADTTLDAIVNLAGEPISDGLWTLAKRRRILRSRLGVTRAVGHLIQRLETKPPVLVSGSAIGWYGLRDDAALDERSLARGCFSHRLCHAWERAAGRCGGPATRVVLLRIGLVLGVEGGMLSRLLTPFEFGLGGPIGSGRQWMSWIALDDMVRLIVHAIAAPALAGPVNATAPEPVRNRDFARALGAALHRPAILAAPALPLRLALGQFADELLLGGQRVLPAKALDSGFRFDWPVIEDALAGMVGAGRPRPRQATRPALLEGAVKA